MNDAVPILAPFYIGPAYKIDGKITNRLWAITDAARDFRVIPTGEPATQKTEARVAYDKNNIYVRFECFESLMDSLVSRYSQEYQPIWEDDSIELWISPFAAACKSKSHRFVVSASGTKLHHPPCGRVSNLEWRAATVKTNDRWIAEMSIPISILQPLGRNDNCWRINFIRNEGPRKEKSIWSFSSDENNFCSSFGKLVSQDSAPARFNIYRTKPASITQYCTESVSGIKPIKEPAKEIIPASCLVPEPQEYKQRLSKNDFVISPDTRIVINKHPVEVDLNTAGLLNNALKKITGYELKIVPAWELYDEQEINNVILIGESSQNPVLRKACEVWEVRMPRSRYGTSSYVIDSTARRIVMSGQTKKDTYYAVQTLKQLLTAGNDNSARVHSALVRDYPQFGFRGFYIAPSNDTISAATELVEKAFGSLKINRIIFDVKNVSLRSCGQTDGPDKISHKDIRRFLKAAELHHIQVIPMLETPGQMDWVFANGQNLEFAEDPENPCSYCMSNPKSYDFIAGIIDEVFELFGKPEYIHTGRRPFDIKGRVPFCESCKNAGKEQLLLRDTLRIYEHLKAKDCGMIICGEVFFQMGYQELVDQLPRDIIITDCMHTYTDTYPGIEFFQRLGFSVIGCVEYNLKNMYSLSSFAARRGITGLIHCNNNRIDDADLIPEICSARACSCVLSSAWAWNPVRPHLHALPFRPQTILKRLISGNEKPEKKDFSIIKLQQHYNVSRSDSGRVVGWLGIGRGNDLRALPGGIVRIDDIPYEILPEGTDIPSAVLLGGLNMLDAFPGKVLGIKAGAKARALHFLQGCAYGTDTKAVVGKYAVRYEDGSSQDIPLVYGENTAAWDDQLPDTQYLFAWQSKGQDGRTIGLCSLNWENPHTDSAIKSIDFIATDTQASPFLLAITLEA